MLVRFAKLAIKRYRSVASESKKEGWRQRLQHNYHSSHLDGATVANRDTPEYTRGKDLLQEKGWLLKTTPLSSFHICLNPHVLDVIIHDKIICMKK